jgi:hypothetical protein
MKKVFTNQEIAHVFCQQSQNNGRSNSMFFEGNKIYSYGYHYLLGEFIDRNTIVINDEGYSQTTSKHIGLLASASSHLRQFYKTTTDIDIVHETINDCLKKMSTVRTKQAVYLNGIYDNYAKLNDFLDYTNKKLLKDDAVKYREIKKIIKKLDVDKDAILAEVSIKEKAKREKEKAKLQEHLTEWRNNERANFYGLKESYLRMSQDGANVETSKGVRIEVDKARLLYRLIHSGKDIVGYKLDYYTVIGIKDGVLKIGCHNIPMNEVEMIGSKL